MEVQIANTGAPEPSLPLLINLPLFRGLDPDGGNLRVQTSAGADLPFAFERRDSAGVGVWVRVPSLPEGVSTLIASACNDTTGRENPTATFDYFGAFDLAEQQNWAVECASKDSIDQCSGLFGTASGESTTLLLQAHSACTAEVENGPGVIARMNRPGFNLPGGRYTLEMKTSQVLSRHTFCEGTAATNETTVELYDPDFNSLESHKVPDVVICQEYAEAARPLSFDITVNGGTPFMLSFVANAGDCVNMDVRFSDLRIRRVPSTVPSVNVSSR
jgi:hypothetical protein